ncbi:MAG: slipin family protein [Planctomycetota bacterium]|jgi:regulator of protease activity HflC (stomatin/prohibitin superfamily)
MFRASANIVAGVILLVTVIAGLTVGYLGESPRWAVVVLVVGALIAASPRIIQEWERGVILRLGRFKRVLKPGVVWVIPGLDQIVALVDMRIRSTSFSAEKTLTKDTVPVDVDAVLFWVVTDAQRAVLEVEYYQPTVSWASQTTLRDVIGKTELGRMISDREGLDRELQTVIDAKTSEWGITVQSVEIRDVKIPRALEDAMSRKAQAEREKEARIILAESEMRVAEEMDKAAQIYQQDKVAMQLRAMNMTYESIKERGALMVIPSGMADSMDPGVLGLAAAGFRVDQSAGEDKKS